MEPVAGGVGGDVACTSLRRLHLACRASLARGRLGKGGPAVEYSGTAPRSSSVSCLACEELLGHLRLAGNRGFVVENHTGQRSLAWDS